MERFPFGQLVGPVTWQQPGRKPVLVVGVYPSAVHGRWVDADGQTRIRAVAVANEPEPFWTGQDAQAHVAAVAATVPAAAGRLLSAPAHNGPSGNALDGLVLAPLGLSREHIRIVDIDNRYMANPAQQTAIAASRYDRLVADGLLPPVTWRPRRPISHIPHDRSPTLADELDEADPGWAITLGREPLRALGLEPLSLGDARGVVQRTPRSALQLLVGTLLSSFGTFWAVQGLGVGWPAGDAAILVLVGWYALAAAGYVGLPRRHVHRLLPQEVSR
jgi:hypothetical protein